MRRLLCTLVAVLCTSACAAQSLTVAPTTSAAPSTPVTITWDVPGGTACQAAGGWSGAQPATGTTQVTVTKTTAFSLVCTLPGPAVLNQVQLSWLPVSLNSAGAPLSAAEVVTGYKLYFGRANPPQTVTPLAANTIGYTVSGLNGGDYFAQLSAVNGSGEGGKTAVLQTTLPTPQPGSQPVTVSGTVTVTAAAGPRPPGVPQNLQLH